MKTPSRIVVAALFAHPDDEAFGPAGTLTKLARVGELHILCATKGEAGKNSSASGERALDKIRVEELRKSARIIGAKSVTFLGYKDGELSHNVYHDIAKKIEIVLRKIRPTIILTSEPRGGSGHIDHIVVSMVSSYVYERLWFIRVILYFCNTAKRALTSKNYFIYVPPGYKEEEIDLKVSVARVWETKIQAMLQHKSQVHDSKRIMKRIKKFPKQENFLIATKESKRTWVKFLTHTLSRVQ